MKQYRSRIISTLLLLVLLLPLWMFVAWLFTSKKRFDIVIIDKTVLNRVGQEHISLMWVLNHQRYVKADNSRYKIARDYYGFFPKRNESYEVKGLEKLKPAQLDSLASNAEAVFLTDAYGVYQNEWYSKENVTERSGVIYGGMSEQDMYLLKRMKQQKKLVLAEFNSLGSPTAPATRDEFERTFGMKWTGWIGRYFDVLDTTLNAELPRWLIRNYVRQRGSWPFKNSGIALVKEDDTIVILENQTHLKTELPEILFSDSARAYYDLPKSIHYSFWFDIITTNDSLNQTLANYQIHTTAQGHQEMQKAGIPTTFPAIIAHNADDYEFWYFSCDFSDNPVGTTSSYFKGVHWFKRMFYNTTDPAQRGGFFWDVYRPLVTRIFRDYKDRSR